MSLPNYFFQYFSIANSHFAQTTLLISSFLSSVLYYRFIFILHFFTSTASVFVTRGLYSSNYFLKYFVIMLKCFKSLFFSCVSMFTLYFIYCFFACYMLFFVDLNMSRALDTIKSVNDSKELWKLGVRLEDIWTVTNQGKEHLEFIILDKQVTYFLLLFPYHFFEFSLFYFLFVTSSKNL
jgi:hypothetical protein